MNTLATLKEILKYARDCCRPKYFSYRFDIITGEETSPDIDNTNVVSYRFINQGNTTALINGGLRVTPVTLVATSGFPFPGSDIDLAVSTYSNEIDTTVYKVKFIEPPPAPALPNNCLLVISKVRSVRRANQMTPTKGSSAGSTIAKSTRPGWPRTSPRQPRKPVYEE